MTRTELLYSVVFRGKPGERITKEDYDEAIEALVAARDDLEGIHGCPVCHGECLPWNCRHNPLVLARVAAQLDGFSSPSQWIPWRCYHCDEVFTTHEEAEAHFGPSIKRRNPICMENPNGTD